MSKEWTKSDCDYRYLVKAELVFSAGGYDIYRCERKKQDIFLEPYGHSRVYYEVNEGDNLLASKKSLDEATMFVVFKMSL